MLIQPTSEVGPGFHPSQKIHELTRGRRFVPFDHFWIHSATVPGDLNIGVSPGFGGLIQDQSCQQIWMKKSSPVIAMSVLPGGGDEIPQAPVWP